MTVGDKTKIYYKNFVVTNVAIDKNQNDYNFYITDKDYIDTTGFTVTLTVLEIDENYLTSSPSFANYYNTFRKYNDRSFSINRNALASGPNTTFGTLA